MLAEEAGVVPAPFDHAKRALAGRPAAVRMRERVRVLARRRVRTARTAFQIDWSANSYAGRPLPVAGGNLIVGGCSEP